MCWENLIKDQCNFTLVTILSILVTISLESVWISLGENWCWPPLGLAGLKGKRPHFQLTSFAQKHLCLSSPIKYQENLESMSFKTLIVLFWGPTAFVLASPARTSILGIIIFSLINMTSSIKVMSVVNIHSFCTNLKWYVKQNFD